MQPMSRKRHPLSRDEAEALAIDALGFLAAEENRLAAFLQASGLAPADLRCEAGSVEFLAGVLDFVAADESLLLVFASERHLAPETVVIARRKLLPDAAEF
jgi:uncharacterized protein DUF3572